MNLQAIALKLLNHVIELAMSLLGDLLRVTRKKGVRLIIKTKLDEALNRRMLWAVAHILRVQDDALRVK